MRRYEIAFFTAALVLVPALAQAIIPPVPMQEPGTASLLGVGLLVIACICGALTLRHFVVNRRSRSTSTNKL